MGIVIEEVNGGLSITQKKKKNGGLSFDISFDLWVSLTKLKMVQTGLWKIKMRFLKTGKENRRERKESKESEIKMRLRFRPMLWVRGP